MNSAINRICCITSIAVWHTIAYAQTADLSPLLPQSDRATEAISEAMRAGHSARAAALLSSLDPAIRDHWAGILALTQNNANAAIRMLRKGDYPKALGVAYYLAGQKILFREQMAEAIRRSPDDFGPYYYLGRYYDSDVDDPEEAARWYRLALDKHRAYAPALSHLGNCLERSGKTAEAEAAYNGSLSEPLSLVGLARLRLTVGDAASALAFIDEAMRLDPRDTMALKLAARIYRELDRPRDAVRVLESAALLAPRDASIQYQLARLYQSIREPAKSSAALRDFERLRAIYGLAP
jgi:tetratricopeptide (TPR) repeat protein